MNHPVKVAERIATLDLLFNGRVHFGVGKGGTQQEAGTFGYDLATLQPQIDEAMYLIPKMFVQDDTFTDGNGQSVIKSRFASEEITADFSDPTMAMMNPNHA